MKNSKSNWSDIVEVFHSSSLPNNKLKSVTGGLGQLTDDHGGDLIDNNGDTHFSDCGPIATGDTDDCGTSCSEQ